MKMGSTGVLMYKLPSVLGKKPKEKKMIVLVTFFGLLFLWSFFPYFLLSVLLISSFAVGVGQVIYRKMQCNIFVLNFLVK